ncbi:MAG: hypothetical protein IID16_00965 [Candidatus Marinimicrobia bacterium]|nr:hypothetical protein [Candidatus Neomarinimicrobiota bacterium]
MHGLEIRLPIKVIPSENYSLMIKDANGVTHYWHKEHTSIINGKKVQFKEGEYDGHSRKMSDNSELHWAIKLRKSLLTKGSWKFNAWLRDITGWLEINL